MCIYKCLLLEDVSALCSAKSFSRYLGALPRSAGSSLLCHPRLPSLMPPSVGPSETWGASKVQNNAGEG